MHIFACTNPAAPAHPVVSAPIPAVLRHHRNTSQIEEDISLQFAIVASTVKPRHFRMVYSITRNLQLEAEDDREASGEEMAWKMILRSIRDMLSAAYQCYMDSKDKFS